MIRITQKNHSACLIIDDPLLVPRYGFLEYSKLLNWMKVHGFFTQIAFIPWNRRRSDPAIVRLFAENPDFFALCVHGCNHTANEFGGTDFKRLQSLAAKGLHYMKEHQKLTGLPFDPVMVFPQGRFSSVSLSALKSVGYKAAVNSTLRATDRDEPILMQGCVAPVVGGGVPLLPRRYPQNRDGFLSDLADGRPILIVEHHEAFADGARRLLDFVDWINGVTDLKWQSLSAIVDQYCDRDLGKSASVLQEETRQRELLMEVHTSLRRMACEYRDNHIVTNDLLRSVYHFLRDMSNKGRHM